MLYFVFLVPPPPPSLPPCTFLYFRTFSKRSASCPARSLWPSSQKRPQLASLSRQTGELKTKSPVCTSPWRCVTTVPMTGWQPPSAYTSYVLCVVYFVSFISCVSLRRRSRENMPPQVLVRRKEFGYKAGLSWSSSFQRNSGKTVKATTEMRGREKTTGHQRVIHFFQKTRRTFWTPLFNVSSNTSTLRWCNTFLYFRVQPQVFRFQILLFLQ